MKLLGDTEEFGRHEASSVVTIGVFDGVHLGHQAIMTECVRKASERKTASVVLTFDRHPKELVAGKRPCLLTSHERKVELIERLGVDYMIVVKFDDGFSAIEPEDFCRRILASDLKAVEVCVGRNFRFGAKGRGNVGLLSGLGGELGFEVDVIDLVGDEAESVSSTMIRSLIREGRLEPVTKNLGRPHSVVGEVVRGHSRGKALGYPTANLRLESDYCTPPDGVYAGRAILGSRRYLCAVNIGTNPTFKDRERTVEVYLLEFSGEIYGRSLEIELHHRLREEIEFQDEKSLISQISRDIETTRRIMAAE